MDNSVAKLMMELVKIDSPSKGELNFTEIIIKRLNKMGLLTSVDKKGNLTATLDAAKGLEQEKPIVFCAHMDTVSTAVNVKPILENGVIKSDGMSALGADDKAAIASILSAVENIIKNNIPHKKIILLFTVEEEIGLEGIKKYDLASLADVEGVLVFDSSNTVGTVVTASPCKIDATVTFNGKAAHAGFVPEKGISAIMLAAKAIDKMNLLRIDEDTTANIGTIKGGEATNIVSEKCVLTLEVRSASSQKAKMHMSHLEICCIKAIGALGGSYTFEINEVYPSYKVEEKDSLLLKVKEVIENSNLKYNGVPSGGGSDTNIMRNNNIRALTLGVGYNNAHSTQESIEIKELNNLTALIQNFAKGL
ncbi:MAG: M20/M25/M40 family metallo-hydrolase [Sphaerochaetaceae bacterium]